MVYIGFVALVQTDMKKLIAYSSIAHMGFVTLGAFIVYDIVANTGSLKGAGMGIDGAMVQMISHGLISGALFLCVGVMYDRMHSREISAYGGVINTMPKFAAFMVLFALANTGLPGTSGFVGEFLVIIAASRRTSGTRSSPATTLVLGAAYTLWLVKRVVFGAVANDHVAELAGPERPRVRRARRAGRRRAALGVWPAPLVDMMQASVQHLVEQAAATQGARCEHRHADTHLGEPAPGAAGDLSHRRDLRGADGGRVRRPEAPRPRADVHAAHARGRRRADRDVRARRPSAWCCSTAATSRMSSPWC